MLLLGLVLIACGDRNSSVIDRQVLNEMEQREPKRVMPNQLMNEAYRRGRALTKKLMADQLRVADSLSLSSRLAQPSYDTLAARVAWINDQSDTMQLTAYEQQLWSAYRYSAERSDPLVDNVQRLSGDSLLYTQPLVLTDSLAVRFPASPDTVGQLLGMWSITLPKRDVVLSIE